MKLVDLVEEKEAIVEAIDQAIAAISFLRTPAALSFIQHSVEQIVECLTCGGKLLIAGNGGSLCDAMHFAEELTGYFRKKRKALPAIALACPAHLTCTANDVGFVEVFARSIEAYGTPLDLLILLSTSGESPNIVAAFEQAQRQGMKVIAFLGKTGGKLRDRGALQLLVDPQFTFSDRIQEVHMSAIHIIIEMVEKRLFDGA